MGRHIANVFRLPSFELQTSFPCGDEYFYLQHIHETGFVGVIGDIDEYIDISFDNPSKSRSFGWETWLKSSVSKWVLQLHDQGARSVHIKSILGHYSDDGEDDVGVIKDDREDEHTIEFVHEEEQEGEAEKEQSSSGEIITSNDQEEQIPASLTDFTPTALHCTPVHKTRDHAVIRLFYYPELGGRGQTEHSHSATLHMFPHLVEYCLQDGFLYGMEKDFWIGRIPLDMKLFSSSEMEPLNLSLFLLNWFSLLCKQSSMKKNIMQHEFNGLSMNYLQESWS